MFLQTSLNLREEIRRQLAEDDAKKQSLNNGKLRKSKSGFLDETSSSDSDDDEELVDVPLTDASTTTSAEDSNDDKEFYLNHEFSTKITLQKVNSNNSNFRAGAEGSGSTMKLNTSHARNNDNIGHCNRDNEQQLVVRPLQSRPNLKTRIQNQKDLQICFLNDFPNVHSSTPSSGRSSSESTSHQLPEQRSAKLTEWPSFISQDFWSPPAETFSKSSVNMSMMPKSQSMFEIETEKQKLDKLIVTQFDETEARWKQEMQMKIQQSHQHIHLQMQRQRRKHKKTPISTKVSLNVKAGFYALPRQLFSLRYSCRLDCNWLPYFPPSFPFPLPLPHYYHYRYHIINVTVTTLLSLPLSHYYRYRRFYNSEMRLDWT